MKPPKTHYAKVGDELVAYQVVGDGPIDLVHVVGFGAIEAMWDHPSLVHFVEGLAGFSRLILFDPRGWGSSARLPPGRFPTWEEWAEDMHVVLDAVGSERSAIFAYGFANFLAMIFAATYPERTTALVFFNSTAKWKASEDYPWGFSADSAEEQFKVVEALWGTEEFVAVSHPSMANDERYKTFMAKALRAAASPRMAGAQARHIFEFDARSLLPLIQTPTLLLHRTTPLYLSVEHAQYLAENIAGAKLVFVPGSDEVANTEAADEILGHIEEFLTGARRAPEADRVLATVLFTDIVGSTERAAALGDRKWKEILNAHDSVAREQVESFRGRHVNTTGDGLLATFDGPARAIRCARAIADEVRSLGVEIRAGLHTGEIELRGADVGGIAVHIGARIASLAGSSEVLVSRTVTDLVAGSGIEFDDRGDHTLKGVPGEWRLFAVRP